MGPRSNALKLVRLMALNDIKVPKENAQGTFDEVALVAATTSADGLMSLADKTKLNGIAAGAEVNVQSNWTEADTASDAFILNKPSTFAPSAHAASHGPSGNDPITAQAEFEDWVATKIENSPSLATNILRDTNAEDALFCDLADANNDGTDWFVRYPSDFRAAIGLGNVSNTAQVTSVSGTAPIVSSGGTTPAISISAATTSAAGSMSSADKTKLDGIATGATANSTDAQLRDRSTHTGTQAHTTITGLGTLATQSGTFSGTSSGTNTGDQTITLTGDVTGSGTGSFVTTIAANAVVNADLAQVATSTLKGRATSGTGNVEDLTATQVRTILNVADGATANSSDATLLNRANHTGTQAAGTITGLAAIATSGSASDLGSGTVPTARLGTGTANSGTFLRGDQTWQAVSGVTTGSVDNAVLRADGTGGGTSQGSAFIIADNATASPNNTVNHASIQATGDTTNVSVSIVPKGTGGFMLSVPDALTSGGNARGDRAVDFQTSRSAAIQVASGLQSFIGNGANNRASGDQSGILCGRSNIASADRSMAGGDGNTSSGINSFAFGQNNTASASPSFCLSSGGVASGQIGTTLGGDSRADRIGFLSHASGSFAANGDAQRFRATLRCKTTTNAAVEMALNGSTTYLTIPSGKVIFCNIKVVGVKSDGSVVATYERQYAAKNVAGTSSEVFAPVTIGTDNASSTSLEVATVDAGDYIRIRPTGIASETWRWVASVDAVEVAYGT